MKKITLILINCMIVGFAWCQKPDFNISEIFAIESDHSYVGFSIKYMGYAMVRGRFTDFQGTVRYSEKDPAKTSVTLSVEVNSIDTGNSWRDDDLRSENWFGAKTSPQIFFISQKAEMTPNGLIITGTLNLKSVTKTISFPLTYSPRVLKDVRGDSQIIFTGALVLNRIDFGIEGKKWAGVKEGITAVSDEVSIELSILAKRINESNFRNWVANENSPEGKIYKMTKTFGTEKALKAFEDMKTLSSTKVNEHTLNSPGMMLLKEKNVDDAIALFRKNIEAFPNLSLVYESYAEAMATKGNWPEAEKYYSLALAKDTSNMNAKEILRHIR